MSFVFDAAKLSDEQLSRLAQWLAEHGQGETDKAVAVKAELVRRRQPVVRRSKRAVITPSGQDSSAASLSLAVLRERLKLCAGIDTPECDEIRAEHWRSDHFRLHIGRILEIIMGYAKEEKFLCYKDITDSFELKFERARFVLAKRLDELCIEQYKKNNLFPTAIVVPSNKLESGIMTVEIIKGFDALFDRLGTPDPSRGEPRIRREQQRVFAWAKGFAV